MTTGGRQVGLFGRAWRGLFGAPNEAEEALKEASSHGAAMVNIARAWSAPLLVAFSIAAVLVLAQKPAMRNIALFQQGMVAGGIQAALMALDWAEVTLILVVVLGVAGADLAVMAASNHIVDALGDGKRLSSVWGHTVIVLAVGTLEAATFTILLVRLESPGAWYEWAFVLLRAVGFPTVAIYLGTLRKRRLTERDSDAMIENKLNARIIEKIDGLDMGTASLGQLMTLRLILTRKGASKETRDAELVAALESLSPDAIQVELDAERRRLREALANAEGHALDLFTKAMLHVMATQELPAWVAERAPELAGLKFSTSRKGSGMRGAKAPVSEPRTRSDAIRYWLESIGVRVEKTPAGRKGIWVKSSDLAALTDNRLTGESATKLARLLGDETKISTAWACPFDRVMSELYTSNRLSSDARMFWEANRIEAVEKAS